MGNVTSNAERQRAHRARRAEVLSAVKARVMAYGGSIDPNVIVAVKGDHFALYSAVTGNFLGKAKYDVK